MTRHELPANMYLVLKKPMGSTPGTDRGHDLGMDDEGIYEAIGAAQDYLKACANKAGGLWDIFVEVYRGRLTRNAWTGEISEKGTPTTADKLLNQLEDALGYAGILTPVVYKRKLEGLLEETTRSPAKAYLQGPDYRGFKVAYDPELWNSLALRMFGESEHTDLYQIYITKWLCGAVYRAMEPGCQMDSALVLRGKQGAGKTSFFRVLFGEMFETLHSHHSTLEQARIMQRTWCCELGELEATFRAKDISALKAFLTETHDTYRDMHENNANRHPRHTVFGASTNEGSFLQDPTGARRFWVIDLGDQGIDLEWLAENRDAIWKAAYVNCHDPGSGSIGSAPAYHEATIPYLTTAEQELSNRHNSHFADESPVKERLEELIGKLETWDTERSGRGGGLALRGSDLATLLQEKPTALHSKLLRDVRHAMGCLGYVKEKRRIDGTQTQWWVKPTAPAPAPVTLGDLTYTLIGP
jgi:Virulence-associated protein E